MALNGQSSGDFKETSGRVQMHHIGIRNTMGALAADAFTQANPPVVVATANVSTTLANVTALGVLGGSVAFTRPDGGANVHGGAVQISSAYDATLVPLGIYINDANGNRFENTPGTASGLGAYLCNGGCISVSIYESKRQVGGSTTLTYAAGDRLYASVNGYLTNRLADAYEYNVSGQNAIEFVTLMGVCKNAPTASSPLLTLDLRV